MKKLMIALITVLLYSANGNAGEPLVQDDSAKAVQQADRLSQPHLNFALYLQYWYGYGETLMRFE